MTEPCGAFCSGQTLRHRGSMRARQPAGEAEPARRQTRSMASMGDADPISRGRGSLHEVAQSRGNPASARVPPLVAKRWGAGCCDGCERQFAGGKELQQHQRDVKHGRFHEARVRETRWGKNSTGESDTRHDAGDAERGRPEPSPMRPATVRRLDGLKTHYRRAPGQMHYQPSQKGRGGRPAAAHLYAVEQEEVKWTGNAREHWMEYEVGLTDAMGGMSFL